MERDRAEVVKENNALRKNNERLTKRVAELERRLESAERAAQSASAMATHYRIKADGTLRKPSPVAARLFEAVERHYAEDFRIRGIW